VHNILGINIDCSTYTIHNNKTYDYFHEHDSSIALITSKFEITLLEEERFNRNKHTNIFPINALIHAL
jgi:predicted NodU family carbamoyl transferase